MNSHGREEHIVCILHINNNAISESGKVPCTYTMIIALMMIDPVYLAMCTFALWSTPERDFIDHL
jgi:hypothetical protein